MNADELFKHGAYPKLTKILIHNITHIFDLVQFSNFENFRMNPSKYCKSEVIFAQKMVPTIGPEQIGPELVDFTLVVT